MEFDTPNELPNGFANLDESDGQSAPSITSSFLADDDWGVILWAPQSHRPDIKPILRFFVECVNDDSTTKDTIKYLTLHERFCDGIKYKPEFFTTELYKQSEPFDLPDGQWNQGKVCFVKRRNEKENFDYVEAKVFHEIQGPLPALNPEAVWAEMPKVEYVSLSHPEIRLRNSASEYGDHTRVVTHEDFNKHETKMVMKIWPSPMCNKDGIEREMMAYQACDGKDITPKFLGHVAEEGRVIGMLIEYIEEAHKPSTHEDKELCRQGLDRFHRSTGWHRNPMANHKDNFLIKDDKAYLIDLSKAYTPEDVASKGTDWATEKV